MKKKAVLRSMGFITICLCLLISAGCGGNVSVEDLDYADCEIRITGLREEAFTITVADLMTLPAVSQKVEASRFNGEKVKVNATGPTLESFLNQYGKSQADFATVRFTAEDQYVIAIPQEILESRQVILAYADGSDPLAKKDQPIQIVVPEERAMYWVRMLKQIDFETEGGIALCNQVVFFENAIGEIPSYAYDDEGEEAFAVKIAELISQYGEEGERAFIVAADGLIRNENPETFMTGYLKYTGDGSPKYVAPHFPEGMRIREILRIHYGNTVFYVLEQAWLESEKSADLMVLEGKTGIPFSALSRQMNFGAANQYTVMNLEGDQAVLSQEEMASAILYPEDEKWVLAYEGALGVVTLADIVYARALL